jgi:hypothetical protein
MLMSPNLKVIVEVLLLAAGFSEAKILAIKIVTIFSVLSDLLSK